MVVVNKLLAGLAAAALTVSGFPIQTRAVINHDAVAGFPETVPSDLTGQLYLKYKPFLKVFNGCVPFPAVDAKGNTSGGLAPTGDAKGGCSSSPGQVYARGAWFEGSYAIMYAWYMPKDSPSTGLGHRHDWENAVVWLSGFSDSATVRGLSVSRHGGYDPSTSPNMATGGTSPLVGYSSYWPVNHRMIHTSTRGGQQPLVAWESLTDAAKDALTMADFGDATVPVKDETFESHLAAAVL